MTSTKARDGSPSHATRNLGTWISRLHIGDIPETARRHAQLCILDSLGCGLFGSQQPWSRMSADAAREMAPGGAVSLWGHSARSGAAAAAMANGVFVHGFEIDDLHTGAGFHPGATIIPAVFSVAETKGCSGSAVLAAIIAGYEIGIRVGVTVGTVAGQMGFHATGLFGCIASSAGVARVLELDAQASSHALSIGAAQSSGLACARRGAMTKRLHAGHAAQSGVVAGLLAARGFTGSLDTMEAATGGFLSTYGADADPAELTDGLGQRWEISMTGFKAYAACASAHTIIDGLDDLMRRGLAIETLDRLRVRVSRLGFKDIGWPYKPGGVGEAQMNGFYAAAIKILDGDAFVDQYSEQRIADPRILPLIGKITIEHDPTLDAPGFSRHASHLEARLTDGRVLETYTPHLRGGSERPMTQSEILVKFRRLAETVIGTASAAELADLVLEIEHLPSLRPIVDLLAGLPRNNT